MPLAQLEGSCSSKRPASAVCRPLRSWVAPLPHRAGESNSLCLNTAKGTANEDRVRRGLAAQLSLKRDLQRPRRKRPGRRGGETRQGRLRRCDAQTPSHARDATHTPTGPLHLASSCSQQPIGPPDSASRLGCSPARLERGGRGYPPESWAPCSCPARASTQKLTSGPLFPITGFHYWVPTTIYTNTFVINLISSWCNKHAPTEWQEILL